MSTPPTPMHSSTAPLPQMIKGPYQLFLKGASAAMLLLAISLSAKAEDLVVTGTNVSETINTSTNYDSTTIGVASGDDGNSLTVTGTGVTVSNGANGIVVGFGGSMNSMTVSGGATVTSDGGLALGFDTGSSSNSLTVTDISTVLQVTNGLFVGYYDGANANNVSVTNGGVINADILTIGAYANANNNSVNISGNGTQLNVTGQLVIGTDSNANGNSMVIANGGAVNSGAAFVGGNNGPGAASSGNSAQVTSGSTWNINGGIAVGDGSSDNSLTISGGSIVSVTNAVVTDAFLKIGTDQAGSGNGASNNSVLVDGAGSKLYVASSLAGGGITIGDTGSGTLTVANGAEIDSPNISIAPNTGSSGTLNVGSFGGTDTAGIITASYIYFGTNGGTATLNFNQTDSTTVYSSIQGNGSVNQLGSGTTVLIGYNTYTGGTLISGGTIQFGDDNTSVNTVGSGVTLTNGGTVSFGQGDSYTVSNAITGNGSLVQSGNGSTILTANNNYTGGTTIERGTLQVGTNGTTGSIGSGSVTMTLGSTLIYNRSDITSLTQNISGEGNLSFIGSGLTILSGTTSLTNGITLVNNGSVAVTGSMNGGSSQRLLVGNTNSGVSLTFSGGNTNYANAMIIGASNGANNNIVRVDNATLITTDTIGVGVRETGGGSGNKLVITNNGVVETGNFFVGSSNNLGGSNNSVIVTGVNSRMINNGSTVGNFIGFGSTGNNITVSNGASLETIGNTFISYSALASNNSVLVTGALSEWTGTGPVHIGTSNSGSADVTITQGASFTAPTINIASQGTLNIGTFGANGTGGTVSGIVSFGSGTGRINFNQSDSATFSNGITGSAGTVNQLGTGTTTISGNNSYGATRVAAGTLLVTGTSGTGNVNVESGATLGGTGTINGATLIQSGATLTPGIAGVGSLSFTNGLTLDSGSTTAMTVNPSSTFTSINVIGSMLTYGGNLEVNSSGLFNTLGQSYELFALTSGATTSGLLGGVSLQLDTGLANMYYNGAVWEYWTGASVLGDQYLVWQFDQANGTLSTQAVPEPSTYVLCGIGALALIIAYRRRRLS